MTGNDLWARVWACRCAGENYCCLPSNETKKKKQCGKKCLSANAWKWSIQDPAYWVRCMQGMRLGGLFTPCGIQTHSLQIRSLTRCSIAPTGRSRKKWSWRSFFIWKGLVCKFGSPTWWDNAERMRIKCFRQLFLFQFGFSRLVFFFFCFLFLLVSVFESVMGGKYIIVEIHPLGQ